jgi:hypothetical protein
VSTLLENALVDVLGIPIQHLVTGRRHPFVDLRVRHEVGGVEPVPVADIRKALLPAL